MKLSHKVKKLHNIIVNWRESYNKLREHWRKYRKILVLIAVLIVALRRIQPKSEQNYNH